MADAHTTCSECGRPMQKAKAVRNGKAFCGTCHKRLSRPAACRGCGRTVNIHPGDDPLCKSCQTQGRTCLRCGKPVPRASLSLPEGVACPSCARHFKEAKPCAACGEPSIHLARDSRLGFDEPVCPKCRRHDHAVCANCGKHRLPVGKDDRGRPLCNSCMKLDGAPLVCPVCGKKGRRHSADRCENCYWAECLAWTVEEFAAKLETPALREAVSMYTGYLGERSGHKKGCQMLPGHFSFFAALDQEPELLQDPRFLVERFGADGLRRFALPYGFLVGRGLIIQPEPELIARITELRRQRSIVSAARRGWEQRLLEEFHHYLLEIQDNYHQRGWHGDLEKFCDQTVTTCIRAGAHILDTLQLTSVQQLDNVALRKYIARNPGRVNPLRSFVRYLNLHGRLFQPIKIVNVRRQIDGTNIMGPERQTAFMNILLDTDTPPHEALLLAFMGIFCQSVKKAVRIRLEDVIEEAGACSIKFAEIPVRLPPEIDALLASQLELRERQVATDPSNSYLFPGRLPGSCLTEAAVTAILRRHGFKAEELFATSIVQAYNHGVEHPSSLSRSYGISIDTAIRYYLAVSGRLLAEVVERHKKR